MSERKRFFTENLNYPENTEAVLSGEEFVHAVTVLRVEQGSEIVLLDGSGKEYSAIVAAMGKNSLTAHILGVQDGDREPSADIYLLCGFLKNADKNEFTVQKAVELGAGRIAFFASRYSSAYMNENKLARLNKISREAAKQCLRSKAPEVEYFSTLGEALKSAADYENKIIACEFLKNSHADINGISGSAALVVGSEGGFSEEELRLAESLGFSGITLGKRILRAETAAIVVCALAANALGELG